MTQSLFSLILVFVLQFQSVVFAADQFPMGPNPQMTPGALCTHPDSLRYPEQIKYCNRNVASDLKNEIIQTYDKQFGYNIEAMDRSKFKIDHFIPLCAGGANDIQNLWPQHESVYTITDPLEPAICDKMAAGKLKQADAVDIIKRGKLNLSEVPALLKQVLAM
jgi:hypothetical protein